MGRLSKQKRDKIIEMIRAGYTTPEIIKTVKCSDSTVNRSRKDLKIMDSPKKIEASIDYVLVHSIIEILNGIETLCTVQGEDSYADYFRECAYNLAEKLFAVNIDLSMKVLFKSDYFNQVMVFLKKRPEELHEKDRRYRRKWIKLLKTWCPEKLAEIV